MRKKKKDSARILLEIESPKHGLRFINGWKRYQFKLNALVTAEISKQDKNFGGSAFLMIVFLNLILFGVYMKNEKFFDYYKIEFTLFNFSIALIIKNKI